MRLLLTILFPLTAFCADLDVTKSPWPKALRDFPRGERIAFVSGGYEITRSEPSDPEVQRMGGSGGPMIQIIVRDTRKPWTTTLLEQSVGERLLEFYEGTPQFEIWGRAGGGTWTRCLYRYISGEYQCIRIDEFEERPRHNNENAMTTEMPQARRGKGDQQEDTLYFVETRTP